MKKLPLVIAALCLSPAIFAQSPPPSTASLDFAPSLNLDEGSDDNGGYMYWLPVSVVGAQQPVSASGSLVIQLEVDSSQTSHPTSGQVVVKMQAKASADAHVMGMGTASGTATVDSTTKTATQTGAGATGLQEAEDTETFTIDASTIMWSGKIGAWIGIASVTTSSLSASAYATILSSSGAVATAVDDEAPVMLGLNPGIFSNTLS